VKLLIFLFLRLPPIAGNASGATVSPDAFLLLLPLKVHAHFTAGGIPTCVKVDSLKVIYGSIVNLICMISLFYLNSGKHGVGRIDIVENRFIGMKSRGTHFSFFISRHVSCTPFTFQSNQAFADTPRRGRVYKRPD
jgi:hypothetical protein